MKCLVVDDSATMRSLIAAVLRRDPEIEVVGEAGDPYEAREAIVRGYAAKAGFAARVVSR